MASKLRIVDSNDSRGWRVVARRDGAWVTVFRCAGFTSPWSQLQACGDYVRSATTTEGSDVHAQA